MPPDYSAPRPKSLHLKILPFGFSSSPASRQN